MITSAHGANVHNLMLNADRGGRPYRQLLCQKVEVILRAHNRAVVDDYLDLYNFHFLLDKLTYDTSNPDFTFWACINRDYYPEFAEFIDSRSPTSKSAVVIGLYSLLTSSFNNLERKHVTSTNNCDDINNSNSNPQPLKPYETDDIMSENIIDTHNSENIDDYVIDEDKDLIHQWTMGNTGDEEIDGF
jgi:hypothetical protein